MLSCHLLRQAGLAASLWKQTVEVPGAKCDNRISKKQQYFALKRAQLCSHSFNMKLHNKRAKFMKICCKFAYQNVVIHWHNSNAVGTSNLQVQLGTIGGHQHALPQEYIVENRKRLP